MTIKPIETYYNGYRFRSRLEARWAVFFDSIGMRWIYEPEGIVLPDGTMYLPDFYLPDCKQFFEVKGVLSDKDRSKILTLINEGYSVTIGYDDGVFEACNLWGGEHPFELTESSMLCHCINCGKYWFAGVEGVWTCQNCGTHDGDHHFVVAMECQTFGKDPFRDTDLWDVARQARFEHGESGVPA